MSESRPGARVGRRPATTVTRVCHVGLELFARDGFDATSVEATAEAAGISRRTFFRYFPSKNDVAWGDFDAQLAHMRAFLAGQPADEPLDRVLRRALLDFNTVPAEEAGYHRQRMALLLEVPALQAHSALKYVGWRRVVAEHVAARRGLRPGDHLPRTVGWVLLGVALAAYEQWLEDPASDLLELLADGAAVLGPALLTEPGAAPDGTARP